MPRHPARISPFFYGILIAVWSFCSAAELYAAAAKPDLMRREARSYREQGFKLQQEGRLPEALEYYRKAAAMDPQYVVSYNDAGIILEALGEFGAAKEMYLKAIKIAPDYASSYSNLASVYEEEGNYTEAVECWMKRAELGPQDDPWKAAAQRRIADIAMINIEARTGAAPQQLRQQPRQYNEPVTLLEKETPQPEPMSIPVVQQVSSPKPQVIASPEPAPALIKEDAAPTAGRQDNKTRAANYLAEARKNFARGQYVAALKEATVAEYIDPSNPEISSFVEQVRKKLLR